MDQAQEGNAETQAVRCYCPPAFARRQNSLTQGAFPQ